jgi:hypothetical protein
VRMVCGQGGVSSVAPKAFRAALVRFAPQFKGYSQQDSQEVRGLRLCEALAPFTGMQRTRSSAGVASCMHPCWVQRK